MKYWLFKSEPTTFSIDDLASKPSQTACWDGVRNYQVRNLLRDFIHKGDLAFFYHSSCPTPGIAGLMEVVSEGYPDTTSWDPSTPGYDPKSSAENPRWYMVDLRFKSKFKNLIPLSELKKNAALSKMLILKTGNRLSITELSENEWRTVLHLAKN